MTVRLIWSEFVASQSRGLTVTLTIVAMLAFAGNSILCRVALRTTSIDPATFTAVRIASAALALWLVSPSVRPSQSGSVLSAVVLFVYAAAFSFAYVDLPAGIGALLLFGAVQITMIGWGFWKGERLTGLQWGGVLIAVIGLVVLLLANKPVEHFSLVSAALMLVAGAAWGMYSLRGRGVVDPLSATRANFLLTVPLAGALVGIFMPERLDTAGMAFAAASGAITSGAGYAIWYLVVPRLAATQAASVQLCVPAVAALFGFVLLGETMTVTQGIAAMAVIGGVAATLRKATTTAKKKP